MEFFKRVRLSYLKHFFPENMLTKKDKFHRNKEKKLLFSNHNITLYEKRNNNQTLSTKCH